MCKDVEGNEFGTVHRAQAEKSLGHSKEVGFYPENSEGLWVGVKIRTSMVRCGLQKDHSGKVWRKELQLDWRSV